MSAPLGTTDGAAAAAAEAGGSPSLVEALSLMLRGATMLKCGRAGQPHFRYFLLLPDMQTLQWTSPKKKADQSSVDLSEIREIRLGQKTTVFMKNKVPEHEHVSFSLLYGDRTLDVVCKDKYEFDTWVIGLRALAFEPHLIKELVDSKQLDAAKKDDTDRLSVTFRGNTTVVQKREDDSDIYTWGQGINGRLGHGDDSDQLMPKIVESLLGKGVRKIACGPSHSVCLTATKELYTWGAGTHGRLGHGHERDRFSPLLVSGLKGLKVHQVACGDYHTMAVIENGHVYSWGKGSDGRLGHGEENENQLIPKRIESLLPHRVTAIACGYTTSAAITSSGHLFTWGGNEKGQLGLGHKDMVASPQELAWLASVRVTGVACASWHTVAISNMGEIFTWGDGSNGKLGHGDENEELVPKKIEEADFKASQVACGNFHTLVLSDTGEVYSWGDGSFGQLGHGASIAQYNKPLKIGKPLEGQTVTQISCGANHSAALSETGQMYTWGYGLNGRLGLGDETDTKVRQIACGGSHSACTIIHGWIPDEESQSCMKCKKQFTFVNRRHHCRNCGGLFCGACSSKRFPLLKDGFTQPVRVCDRCHQVLSSASTSSSSASS